MKEEYTRPRHIEAFADAEMRGCRPSPPVSGSTACIILQVLQQTAELCESQAPISEGQALTAMLLSVLLQVGSKSMLGSARPPT